MEGDRNTQYFHRKAVWRARKKIIRQLRKADDTWVDTPTDMERVVESIFRGAIHK